MKYFNDRIERKYQVGIHDSEVAGLWRDLSSFLHPYGLQPVQEITSVGSVYFDNRDCDLLRYSLFGRLMLVRVRAYELFGRMPEPIHEYWIEVKTAAEERRRKRRFRVDQSSLLEFLEDREIAEPVVEFNRQDMHPDELRELYRETQETVVTMGLRPHLLVLYKRVAFQSQCERLSIDWDIQYHHATADIFDLDSWKYLSERPAGSADKVVMEIKYLQGEMPEWFEALQERYPIWRREYLKPVEGMGFLFQGPLRTHPEAHYFQRLIGAYMSNSRPLR